MKLYIKQKVFSIGSKFSVKNEYGDDVYAVEGAVFALLPSLRIYDKQRNEVAIIKQKGWTLFKPRFQIIINDVVMCEIVKEITFLKSKYTFLGVNWQIDGNVLDYNYNITSGDFNIATIQKKLLSWGDSYEIDISENTNEILVIAGVLAIDCVKARNN